MTSDRSWLPLLALREARTFRERLVAGRISWHGVAALASFVAVATAVYGTVLAGWRSPRLVAYVALKLPLLFLGAPLVVGSFGWVAAQLLGAAIRFRDMMALVFGALAVSGWVLLALAPVALFLIASSVPAEGSPETLHIAHNTMLVAHCAALAGAGVAGVVALRAALLTLLHDAGTARAVGLVWLVSYAFVGCQLAWILRPFVGSPFYPVVFLRPDALERNFYEFVFGEVLPYLLRH